MAEFTKRDREFIITLANNIQKLRKDFDEYVMVSPKQQPKLEKPRRVMHRNKSEPVIHAEFYRTDDKNEQVAQVVFVETLEEMLREMCEQNGIAFLSIEIDLHNK